MPKTNTVEHQCIFDRSLNEQFADLLADDMFCPETLVTNLHLHVVAPSQWYVIQISVLVSISSMEVQDLLSKLLNSCTSV